MSHANGIYCICHTLGEIIMLNINGLSFENTTFIYNKTSISLLYIYIYYWLIYTELVYNHC